MRLDFRGKTRIYINKQYTNKVIYSQSKQRLRIDFRMIRRVFLARTRVRPPLSDLAAVKKHAFAPKRYRNRGYIWRTPAASVSGAPNKKDNRYCV